MAGGMVHYIKVLETKPIGVTVRAWRKIRSDTMTMMGQHWHKYMLPLHFEPNAKYVYHYRNRKAKYQEEKERGVKRGFINRRPVDPRAATDALTLTGTLRKNVTQIATIRAFEQRFKLVMPGTSYTPDRPRTAKQPPLAQEVTKLLEREKKELAKLGKAFVVNALNALKSNS